MNWFEFLGRPYFDNQTYQALTFLFGLTIIAAIISYLVFFIKKTIKK